MISPFILYHSMNFTKLALNIYNTYSTRNRLRWDIPGFVACELSSHISIKLYNKSHEIQFGDYLFCAKVNDKNIRVIHPNIQCVGEYSIEDIEDIYRKLSDLDSYYMYIY